MKQFAQSVIFMLFMTMLWNLGQSQSRYLQLDLNGGISKPMGTFANDFMFAGQGYHAGGGFDFFFNKIGIGVSGGLFSNKSETLFNDYIKNKYLEAPSNINSNQQWSTKYIMAGPVVKFGFGKFEVDFLARFGISQINVPNLIFTKEFFNQTYEVYRFSGSGQEYQFAWTGGTRLIYKVNSWLGIQAKADYFATKYVSDINYDYTYRNANDGNRNGVMEDSEYFESQKLNANGKTDLSVLNLNVGFIFQLGKPNNSKIKMIPNVSQDTRVEEQKPELVAEDKEKTATPIVEDQIVDKTITPKVVEKNDIEVADNEMVNKQEVETKAIKEENAEIPVVNAEEEREVKMAEEKRAKEEPVQIPATSYDAPEAKYDAEAAEFLYKAGESYFAMNDFENALPCFNKLKADPNYPRSKYMFALSLCAMGNCDEGKREYKEFAKTYKEADARTLEIIFASQFERCGGMLKAKQKSARSVETGDNSSKTNLGKEYKIQFIAIKKPDAAFPGVAKVGTIQTEYFPNKSVYRYTISGFGTVQDAAIDLAKVRKMGFRDAFIAVYENGNRVNTIYHKR